MCNILNYSNINGLIEMQAQEAAARGLTAAGKKRAREESCDEGPTAKIMILKIIFKWCKKCKAM